MSTERKELIHELEVVAKQVANLIKTSDTSKKIPHSEWTVGDAAAHLVITQRLARDILQGKKSPYGEGKPDFIAEVNKEYLEKFTERNRSILLKMLLKEVSAFLRESEKYSDDHSLPTHYGSMNMLLGISYCLSHLLGHGCAIANALEKPLLIKVHHIRITLPFLKTMLPRIYDKNVVSGSNLTFVFDMRGMEKFAVICSKKDAVIEEHIPRNVDCYIFIDPLALFLITNNFMSQWKALLMGKLLVWGKRPWMILKLKDLFPSP